ncbi:MAG TPA: HD-GYP domain-containing protein [Thermoanaerobaculia bacterium]|nr:HD-GYP domain-containing protein [Thermoanaerobaculia bacterium]
MKGPRMRCSAACFAALLLTAAAFVAAAVLLLQQLGAAEAGARDSGVRGGFLLLLLLGALLAAQIAFVAVRRQAFHLSHLVATIARMAETGELKSDFEGAGGGPAVERVEETLRRLLQTLEESLEARERSYVEALGTVVTAVDARDHEITGHSFRVAAYAVTLARALGVEGALLKAIEWGALLHDLGKMVVPDAVLRKGGPLSSEEWHIMRQHPTWGFEMLAEVRFLQQAAVDIVYAHHERWDGAGYPRGLTAEAIPLAARIFAVVDTYDAITSDRPYRRARGHVAAVAELQRVAGSQLDPAIVEGFARLPEVELRRLRELYRHVHPGLSLPAELFDSLLESGVRKPLSRNRQAT